MFLPLLGRLPYLDMHVDDVERDDGLEDADSGEGQRYCGGGGQSELVAMPVAKRACAHIIPWLWNDPVQYQVDLMGACTY